MERWLSTIVFVALLAATSFRVYSRWPRGAEPACQCLPIAEPLKTVPITKRRPRRFEDGRIAPFEATTDRNPNGAAAPIPRGAAIASPEEEPK
jgi:hypothetical protein